jgi:Domain of unknown function (DUF4586)
VPFCIGAFNKEAGKGKQMLCSDRKIPDGTMAGYFASEFSRVFIGEAYQDTLRLRRQDRRRAMLKNIDKNWVPNSFEKMP